MRLAASVPAHSDFGSQAVASKHTAEGFDDLLVQSGKRKSLLSYVFFQASEEVSHEVAQAFARILIVSLLTLFFLVSALKGGDRSYVFIGLAYGGLAVAHYFLIVRFPDRHLWRRYLVIAADLGMVSYSAGELGLSGLGFYPLFLWIVIGNGLRFGVHYLRVSTVVGLVGFVLASWQADTLSSHPGVVFGLGLGLLMMPKFFMVMIKRLAEANHALMEERDKAEFMAKHDALTGLPNRALLEDHLELALAKARRDGSLAAIVFIDLDSFKSINDNFGHQFGDMLLKKVGACLRSHVRAADTVARLGGDEFIVLIEDLKEPSEVAFVVERAFGCVGRYYRLGDYQTFVTWSGGVAIFPQDGADAQTLIKHADTAMYRAKASGTNQLRFYDGRMSEEVAAQLALRDELRKAIELGQFEVLYQPIVAGLGGRIAAVEALLRWNHPTRGLVAPDAFIRVAEQTGLIVPIGRHVLELACRDLAEWRRAGHVDLTVHVNVSARQLAHADFVDVVLAVLDHAALPPQALALEVTESTLIEDTATAETLFSALKDLGVAISLDDFGTGYSSLAYLKRFSIDHIKIDRSFVAGIPGDPSDCTLVEAILAIAERFGAVVVAEGVETATQAEWLRAHDCPLMQGWHFGRPMPAGALLARLDAASPRPTPLHRYRQR